MTDVTLRPPLTGVIALPDYSESDKRAWLLDVQTEAEATIAGFAENSESRRNTEPVVITDEELWGENTDKWTGPTNNDEPDPHADDPDEDEPSLPHGG